MSDLYAFSSLIALLLAAFFLTRVLAPRHRVEGALFYVLVLSTGILWLGYLLSAMNQLRSLAWWAAASVLVLGCVLLPILLGPRLRADCLRKVTLPHDIEERITHADFRRFDTRVLLALTLTMALTAAVNFIIILKCRGIKPRCAGLPFAADHVLSASMATCTISGRLTGPLSSTPKSPPC